MEIQYKGKHNGNGISWDYNSTPYILEILKNTLQKKYNRERDRTHVSDTVYCPRHVVLRKLFPKLSTNQKEFMNYLRGEYIHKGIQDLLRQYSTNRFIIEETIGFKGNEVHTLTGKLKEYEIKATSDIEDTLLDLIIDIKSMNKEELLWGPQPSHLNQVAYYMTITNAKRGQLLYILLKNEDNPFRAFDVKVTDEWRNNTKKRLILETRDIEDAVELNRPELARHVRFDDRYNWKCHECTHRLECDEYLTKEINLPIDKRRWWDTYRKRSLEVKKRVFWTKK